MASDNPTELAIFEKSLCMVDAIDGIKLSKLEKTVGEIQSAAVIIYLLERFNDNFNVARSLTQSQATIIAYDIIEKYPHETLEDVVLMLKMVRQGVIGDGKDYKLDGQNILGKDKWMDQYLDLKYAEVERIKQREKSQLNNAADTEHAVTKYYAKLRADKARKEKEAQTKSEIDAMVKNMTRDMLETKISEWAMKPEMLPYLDYLKQQRRIVK